MAYGIDENKCIGCGACAWVCIFDVPCRANDEGTLYFIDKEKCVGCGQCENMCPNNAIAPLPDHKRIRKVTIEAEKCIGCTVCYRTCPEGAPKGERGKPFEIDQSLCTRCGACAAKCAKKAIAVEYEE